MTANAAHPARTTCVLSVLSVVSVLAMLLWVALLLAACLPVTEGREPAADGGGVGAAARFQVTAASMAVPGGPALDGLGPASALWVDFSRPCDLATLSQDTVVLVKARREDLNDAFLADVDHPPLSELRRAQRTPAAVALEGDGTRLVVRPAAPLEASSDYVLVLSAALRSGDGQPLSRPDGTPGGLVLPLRVGPPGAGPPWLALVSPPPGLTDVPTNLREVVVAASEPVSSLPEGLVLRGEDGSLVTGAPEASVACPADPVAGRPEQAVRWSAGKAPGRTSSCFLLRLASELQPGLWYEPAALGEVFDADGEPLAPPLPGQRFRSGLSADLRAPKLSTPSLLVRDRYLTVSVDSDELVTLTVAATPALADGNEAREAARFVDAGPARSFAVLLDGLWPAQAYRLQLVARDAAGNVTELFGELATAPALPPVAITEVLADAPTQPETGGEFVELHNRGEVDVDLTGWSLSDRLDGLGGTTLSGAVPAGGYALVVAHGYAGPVPPGATVVVAGNQIVERGLANGGEPLVLRDADGRTVSTYRTEVRPAEGVSVERVAADAPDLPESWVANPRGRTTPGGANDCWLAPAP